MKNKVKLFEIKSSKTYVLTLLLLSIAGNCFSQWKTEEVKNIKSDIIISYEVSYDRELSSDEKKSPEYLREIIIAFNKDKMTERTFGSELKTTNNFSLFNFNTLKAYKCLGSTKKAIQYDFKDPEVAVDSIVTVNPKTILNFPCEKGITLLNNTPKKIYYTKKIGLKYCKRFKIDGFLMDYPGYSKTLGYYTVKATKINCEDLPESFYSLTDFSVQKEEDYKKNLLESTKKSKELSMRFIGEKADTFKDISLKNEKIDTKKMLGDIIVYNFWFTTCAPCKAEIPKLNQLREKYKDKNVHFIAIALNPGHEIIPFLKTIPLAYTIIPEGRWIAEMFGIKGYPTNIIVDKKGIVQFYEMGYKKDIEERMSAKLDEYLEQ